MALRDADDPPAAPDYDKEPVPRLPRGKGGFLSTAAIFRIAMLVMLLTALLVMRKPCASGVARFIGQFEDKPDAGTAQPQPQPGQLPPGEYIKLDGPLTEKQLEELRKRARAKARDAGVATDGGAAATTDANPPPKRQ